MRVSVLSGALMTLLGAIAPSHASEWIFTKEDKAFGEKQATAMAVGDESIVFVKCSEGELGISLATPEDWKDGTETMNSALPKIVMAVDGSEPFSYAASISENQVHKILVSVDDQASAKEAIEKLMAAKKKIEIGLEIGGKRFYASKLTARGASKKFQSVLDVCVEKEEKPQEIDAGEANNSKN